MLITTPESLYLLLGSQARAGLAAVETVIVDEIHVLAPSKRGVHLALTLERLAAHCVAAGAAEPQRIGLSATQRPLEEVARYLGDRPVAIVDAGEPPRPISRRCRWPISAPPKPPPATPAAALADSRATSRAPAACGCRSPSACSSCCSRHRTTILVNSRRTAERLATQLTELARACGRAPSTTSWCAPTTARWRGPSGSRSRPRSARRALRAITATSLLELGIDMGAVDLVILCRVAGRAVARGLQRVRRAGHQVGAESRGRIVPKVRGDLLEVYRVPAACSTARSRPPGCRELPRRASRSSWSRCAPSGRTPSTSSPRSSAAPPASGSSGGRCWPRCSTCSAGATRPTSSPSCGRG
ncbi:MAG: hypothetical protein R2939_16210 [Kofleriaceae bacterium]